MTIMNMIPGVLLRRVATVYSVVWSTFASPNTCSSWFGLNRRAFVTLGPQQQQQQQQLKDLSQRAHEQDNLHGTPDLMEVNAPLDHDVHEPQNPPDPIVHHEPKHQAQHHDLRPDIIHQLVINPALYSPLRKPRYPIVLCHGLYGFDTRGPASFPKLKMEYWYNVLAVLRDTLGAEVIVTTVPSTGSIQSRADKLHRELEKSVRGRGVNFFAHSMGGLDCRHLISHIQPKEYTPLSLMSIGTPHRGSPFMDWCAEYIGIGRLKREMTEASVNANASSNSAPSQTNGSSPLAFPNSLSDSFNTFSKLPSTFTTRILSIVDSPAYANLTSSYLTDIFNPSTPDDPNVKYFSVTGRMNGANIWHPFWLSKLIVDGAEERERRRLKGIWEGIKMGNLTGNDVTNEDRVRCELWDKDREWGNDGLVTVQSSKWGEFLGVLEGCDHWEMRGARGIEFGVDLPAIPALGLRPSGDVPPAPEASSRSPATTAENNSARVWNLKEWTSFVRAFDKEEKKNIERSSPSSSSSSSSSSQRAPSQTSMVRTKREDEEMIKSTSDNLSRVIDWLVEHVPTTTPLLNSSSASPSAAAVASSIPSPSSSSSSHPSISPTISTSNIPHFPVTTTSHGRHNPKVQHKKKKKKSIHDLETRVDLERFYLALSRKLYDEGL